SPPPDVRARLLGNESARRGARGDKDAARAAAEEALRLADEAGDDEGIGGAANTLARTLIALGDYDCADELAERAAAAFRRARHGLGEVRAIGTRAAVAQARKQPEESERLYRRALEEARAQGYRLVLEELLLGHALVLVESG